MSAAYVIVTALAAGLLTFSFSADLFLRQRVLANMDRAGVPRSWLPKVPR